jgi:hypothetical protein
VDGRETNSSVESICRLPALPCFYACGVALMSATIVNGGQQ